MPEADNQYSELLIGCGSRRIKLLFPPDRQSWHTITTLDINPSHKPDVVWDLNNLPLPFADNSFNEIHAYEVLEHTGRQGDYHFFFAQFTDFWRILKPNGLLIGTSPMYNSPWAFGDPSHTRVIQKESFVFLDQTQYTVQIGKTAMTDFRYIYQADFALNHVSEEGGSLQFALQAIKPSRIEQG